MPLKLKNNAIFISDSHDNENRKNFLNFLKAFDENKIEASQLFLMGDMFDYLSSTDYSIKFYKEQIDLLNKISLKSECYYFEGNHDFNLKEIFPNIKVFPIQEQPVEFILENMKTVQFAHGDKFLSYLDSKILLFLRNKTFLKIMNFFDNIFSGFITKKILKSQVNKTLYTKIENFSEVVERKIKNYNANYIIEGHYHQDLRLDFKNIEYFNLNSFAVIQKIYRVKIKNNVFFLKSENINF